jgi:hypothetical protein
LIKISLSAGGKRNAASDELSGRRLDLIAQRIYRVELADQGAALRDQMIRDPEMTEVALDPAAGPLDRGSTGGGFVAEVRPAWQSRQAQVRLLSDYSRSALIRDHRELDAGIA